MKDTEIIAVENTLTAEETTEFQRLEEIVDKGMKSFVEAGVALMEIREKRLYRAQYKAFEDYLKEKWELQKPMPTDSLLQQKS